MGVGELAAFATALCWTVTVMSFEVAGKLVGSLPVNILRLFLGLLFLSVYSAVTRGMIIPVDASGHIWFWLGLSGIVGFVVGDICLFRAFVLIGSRITMVIFALVPPITALVSHIMLGETLTTRVWAGMLITVTGISMVILIRGSAKIRLAHPVKGLILALGGTIGQAVGLVFSKYGVGTFNAFAATQIRIIAAVAALVLIIPAAGFTGRVVLALKRGRAMGFLALGSFFGPFLGVSLSLVAIKNIEVGIASTIMAMVPVFIIIPEVFLLGKKVRALEVAGAIIAVAGVALVAL